MARAASLVPFCLLLAAPLAFAAVRNAVVVAPVANLYSKPSSSADVVSQALFGFNVQVLKSRRGWAHVRTPDAYTGWVQRRDLRYGPPYAPASTAAVAALFANVYRETDITRHQPLFTLPFEARLDVAPVAGNPRWLELRLPDSRTAWIQAGDVALAPTRDSVPALIAFSRRFLGLPYLWAGVSTFGYDCSGFTQMLCRRRGVLIPRDADQQEAWTGFVPVVRGALEPGDFLYFGETPKKITHTGMYIGNGEFINATPWQHPVVQICRLADDHWTRLFQSARRLKP